MLGTHLHGLPKNLLILFQYPDCRHKLFYVQNFIIWDKALQFVSMIAVIVFFYEVLVEEVRFSRVLFTLEWALERLGSSIYSFWCTFFNVTFTKYTFQKWRTSKSVFSLIFHWNEIHTGNTRYSFILPKHLIRLWKACTTCTIYATKTPNFYSWMPNRKIEAHGIVNCF